jgi:hypothetical protein
MTPEQRLKKALELTELGRTLLLEGMRRRHPGLSDREIREIYLSHLARCHNRNY